jgi:hypothetical protein
MSADAKLVLRLRTKLMIKTVEAVIDERGNVTLLERVRPDGVRRALVTILEERPTDFPAETAFLSETALAQDWDRPEEDEAWKHLQKVP